VIRIAGIIFSEGLPSLEIHPIVDHCEEVYIDLQEPAMAEQNFVAHN
jgi:hypothetical protein